MKHEHQNDMHDKEAV